MIGLGLGLNKYKKTLDSKPLGVGLPDVWYNPIAENLLDQSGGSISDGEAIGTILDAGSLGEDLIRHNTSDTPVWNDSEQNGQPGIIFTGTEVLKNTTMNISQGYTIFIVCKSTSGANSYFVGQTNGQPSGLADSGSALRLYGGTVMDRITSLSSYSYIVAYFDGSNSYVRKNGSQVGSVGNAGTNAKGGFVLGAFTPTLLYLTGGILEVAIYSRELTAGEIGKIESYASSKFGL